MKHTEKSIIDSLYLDFGSRKHSIQIHNNCNTLSYVGESDFISVTKNGMIHEVEVKISKADYKNDFTKKQRHQWIKQKSYDRHIHLGYQPHELRHGIDRKFHHSISCIDIKKVSCGWLPNYFYYAMPENMINLEDIPDYCGVIFITENGETWQVRGPKRIHKENVTYKQLFSMGISQSFRIRDRIIRERYLS